MHLTIDRRDMETKHTPGPWEVTSGDNYEIRSPLMPREYPHQFKNDSTGDFVAYIGNHAKDFGYANANLIAAAPDLLAAAEAALNCVAELPENPARAELAQMLTDAIAKALGRDA
jgi:hypothetical protein